MANRTVKDAHSVHGTNPQYLIEKIIRTRIYECRYWKEECFALSAELMVDKAMELRYIGGTYGGNIKPTPFICLLLKMLQIQPEKDIVVEFIRNEDFKYVRALGATYMRLTGTSLDCYKYLEPLYLDYRKIRRMNKTGGFELTHMDELIDELLREEKAFDIILPRLQKRSVLEENAQIEQRVSVLEEDLENMETSDEEELYMDSHRSPTPERRRGGYRDLDKPRSPSPKFRRSRSRSPRREKRSPGRRRSRSRERRHRSRSKERRHKDDDDRRKSKKSKREHRSHEDRHKDRDREHRKRDRRDRDRDHDRDDSKLSKKELEIKEANEMRARLGLPPLR